MKKFKWLSFLTKNREQIKAYESWSVRWTSFYYSGYSIADINKEAEVFTTKEDAEKFLESLKAARKLLKDSSLSYTLEKN